MMQGGVARRYAQALFELAAEQHKIDEYEKELSAVVATIGTDRELAAFLKNQVIAPSEKKEVFRKTFGDRVSPAMASFLDIVVEKKREAWLPAIAEAYTARADRARGVQEVEVRTAVALSDEDLAAIGASLEQSLKAKVRLQARVDPRLIGGVTLKIGDRLVDGSVRGRLDRLKSRLVRAEVER